MRRLSKPWDVWSDKRCTSGSIEPRAWQIQETPGVKKHHILISGENLQESAELAKFSAYSCG
jgi:hypothetical protein